MALRWLLAPFGAVAALGLAIFITYIFFGLIYGAELKNKESAPFIVSNAVAVTLAFVGWTWAGSRIVPLPHRRLALGLFSIPVVMLALAFLVTARMRDRVPPSGLAITVGALLACAAILILAFHPRFAAVALRKQDNPRGPVERTWRAEAEPLRSSPAATSFGTSNRPAAEASRQNDRDRQSPMTALSQRSNAALAVFTILRWVLAPVGAGLCSFLALGILYSFTVATFGKQAITSGPAVFMAMPVVMCALMVWVFAGSFIAPARHRGLALAVFSVPVALLTLFSILQFASGRTKVGGVFIVAGCLLTCVTVWVYAQRYAYVARRRKSVDDIAEVFSDEPSPVPVASSSTQWAPKSQASPTGASFGNRSRSSPDLPERPHIEPLQATRAVRAGRPLRSVRELIEPAEQSAVAADLAAYFGPDSEIYLDHYERMVRQQKISPWGWHWPGFFTGYVWFFYRRMNAFAFMLMIVPVILYALLPGGSSGGLLALGGMFAKNAYVQYGFHHILRADRLGLVGEQRVRYLQSKGGVSPVAAAFAGLFLAIMLALAILAIVSGEAGPSQLPRVRSA